MRKFGTFSNPDTEPRRSDNCTRFDTVRKENSRFAKTTLGNPLMQRLPAILAALAVAVMSFYAGKPSLVGMVNLAEGCDIKGNISKNSDEKIYHMPGQKYYDATRISPQYGERWFCTEAEAKAAGWRTADR
jgi:hypothetical protein